MASDRYSMEPVSGGLRITDDPRRERMNSCLLMGIFAVFAAFLLLGWVLTIADHDALPNGEWALIVVLSVAAIAGLVWTWRATVLKPLVLEVTHDFITVSRTASWRRAAINRRYPRAQVDAFSTKLRVLSDGRGPGDEFYSLRLLGSNESPLGPAVKLGALPVEMSLHLEVTLKQMGIRDLDG